MPIPVTVEDQSQIPEGMENYYQEQDDGKLVLDVEGVDNHPNVVNLKTAYQKEKEKRQKVAQERDKLKPKAEMVPDDVEPETIQNVIERIQNGEDPFQATDKEGNKTGEDPAKIKEQVEQRWKSAYEQKEQEVSQKNERIRRLVVDNALTSALQKNKISNPTYQKAAKRLLENQIKVQEDDNGDLQPIVETDMGELSLDQYVREWTSGEEGAAFVDGNSGSGARGANAGPKGKNEMARSKFQAMEPRDQKKFIQNGGKVVED